MGASIVNVCSRLGVVKVNKWFTLRATEAYGTPKPLQNGRSRGDRQHFSHEFMGAGDSTGRSGGHLDGLLFDSPRILIRAFPGRDCGDSLFVLRKGVIYMLAEIESQTCKGA